jgi:diaminopimelate decarboxylase
VQYVKTAETKKFVIVDAGMNDLIRPALYESFHEIVPVTQRPGAPEKVDIVGPVCESGDFFAQDRTLPPLAQGDCIALMSAGAYGASMSSNYNSRPLPVEILVRGERAVTIRQRQTPEDLIRNESIPQW